MYHAVRRLLLAPVANVGLLGLHYPRLNLVESKLINKFLMQHNRLFIRTIRLLAQIIHGVLANDPVS